MIQQESRVIITDNSGGRTWKVIRVLKWTKSKTAGVWDKVVIAVRTVNPSGQLEKGTVVRWVVVRVRKEVRRKDGTYIRFNDNAVAIISKTWDPVGKRIFGPVARELRERWFRRLATMAEEVV